MKGYCRHDEIFSYIKSFQRKHYRLPTRKEIVYDCKIGRGPLQRLINRLEEKGKLKRMPKGILEFRIAK